MLCGLIRFFMFVSSFLGLGFGGLCLFRFFCLEVYEHVVEIRILVDKDRLLLPFKFPGKKQVVDNFR